MSDEGIDRRAKPQWAEDMLVVVTTHGNKLDELTRLSCAHHAANQRDLKDIDEHLAQLNGKVQNTREKLEVHLAEGRGSSSTWKAISAALGIIIAALGLWWRYMALP